MKLASLRTSALIWFGAAVSVAEIQAGIDAGINWSALILGHLLGGLLLFGAGYLGAVERKNAMETTGDAFGTWGAKFFAALNVLQLVGWTAVMLSQATATLGGARWMVADLAAIGIRWETVTPWMNGFLAVLVAVWIFIGLRGASRIAQVAMGVMALLMLILTGQLLAGDAVAQLGAIESVPFWPAFEMSVAMPLSWLPLIADYTKDWDPKDGGAVPAPLVGAVVYTLTSIWMYGIGMVIGGTFESASLAGALTVCNFKGVGVLIVVFSTVTTTFLDAYSAGESSHVICGRIRPKAFAVGTAAVGAVLATWGIVDRYVDFLYLISSVFAPMAAVLLTSRFVVARRVSHSKDGGDLRTPLLNGFAWLVGFGVYQAVTRGWIPAVNDWAGATIPAMGVAAVITLFGRIHK